MKTHKLMIKTHNKTGLKYLCYTRSEGKTYDNYRGSGVYWKSHLKLHGDDISTELIFESQNFKEFKKMAITKSHEFDVVDSPKWANLKIEEGDGGDTVSNKRWITNGQKDKYWNKDVKIPKGWKYGRSKCVFNSSTNQKRFSKLVDLEKRGSSIKAAWNNPEKGLLKRDHSKCGTKGENNPAKRLEVRKKISLGQKAYWGRKKNE